MDYVTFYEKLSLPFRSSTARMALLWVNRCCVAILAISYIASLVYLTILGSPLLPKALLVPLLTFVVVTIIRVLINRPRPYEQWPIEPLIEKSTKGKSLPSRHGASAVILAATLSWLWYPLGFIAWLFAAAILIVRILTGAHYPTDVLAALIVALLCAEVGFNLIGPSL